MNRQDLIAAIAADTESSKAAVGRFVDSFIDNVMKSVASGESVKLSGFGSFEKSKVAARTGRNPKTGQAIRIPPSVRPRFTPGCSFKQIVKG